MPPRRQPISLELKREYKDLKTSGQLSGIIDFHLHGKNRYMKINQPLQSSRVSPRSSSPMRSKKNQFKNPVLNRYEDSGDEEYEAKQYVFEYQEDNDDSNNVKKEKKKNRRKVKHESKNGQENNQEMSDGDANGDEDVDDPDKKIDDKKVGQTVKMIEDLLKEKKKPKKKRPREDEKNGEDDVTEDEREKYLREKNIQSNKSTNQTEDGQKLAKKPKKKLVAEMNENKKNLQTSSTQTPRDTYEQLKNDHLRFAQNGNSYVQKLIDDVEIINQDYQKDNNTENDDQNQTKLKSQKGPNSLGLSMEGKNGVNMAIIKGKRKSSQGSVSSDQQTTKFTDDNGEQVLLRKNYQNLETLITVLMEKDSDSNYLKLAKLNRLKVLIELAMSMVGRKYKEISVDERNSLELQANRYHTTYPLPGEEEPLKELDENGQARTRLPIKIVQEDGLAKIDLNDKFIIDPSEFLKIYSSKIINHAEESTGLQFDNITVTIPAAYGAQQREAIKNSLNQASDRDDVKILTRPVAAAVILNNQRNPELEKEKSTLSSSSNVPDAFKLVFDITEGSMDASVIRIKESKDFQVVSNVGDTSFGVHDIDERIVEHIIKEKAAQQTKNGDKSIKANDVETVNAYASLVANIKENVAVNGAVCVDLATMEDKPQKNSKKGSKNEIVISKNLISRNLCKDIYDWSLAHIEKSINQSDVTDKDIDEIILIGSESKLPGFKEYLKEVYPKKKINFVPDEDLAVGAAIVGKKLKYQQIKVTEVLCRSIGIGLYTGVITYLLFRNSSLPCVGGCVYSTLVDDQESMILDIYEGERPHVKFCRYLGEVTICNLPKGEAGKIKCEVYLKMNNEGLLEVTAKDLTSGKSLDTAIDANPDSVDPNEVNNNTDLDPIEAERYKKADLEFVYQLEVLDEYLESLSLNYRKHKYSVAILEKIFDTKEWLYKNRRNVSINEIESIRHAIEKFLKNIDNIK